MAKLGVEFPGPESGFEAAPMSVLPLTILAAASLAAAGVDAASPAQPGPTPPAVSADSTEDQANPASESPAPPVLPAPAIADVQTYDAAVRATSQSAESYQGPLDGGWMLSGGDGRAIYRFQIADGGPGILEGAWRDLQPPSGGPHTGFLSSVTYDGSALTLRFDDSARGDQVVIQVKASGQAWSGELWRHGRALRVTLKRP